MIRFHLSCLGVVAAHALVAHAFQLQPPPSFLSTKTPSTIPTTHTLTTTHKSPTQTSTYLHGKAWDKLGIEEDPPTDPPAWYLMNCVAGVELQLLAQAKIETQDLRSVEKIVVPTGRHLRSHGKRNVVEIKVAYPGYVFCKMRLTVESYEALQGLDLCRSWMAGTVNLKGYTKIPPAPIALGDEEVEKFRGLEEKNDEMYLKYGDDYTGKGDQGDDLIGQYASYEVEDMVKVLSGNFEGEDGVVRRLKDGNIMVRMYTYGSALDQWHKPEELRKMSQLEVAKGLTGPTGAIDQDQFDVSIGKKVEPKKNDDRRRPPSLIGSVTGGTGNNGRDRRQDRMSRGESGRTDIYGRTEKQAKDEENNWKLYREKERDEQQKQKKVKIGDTWGMKENSSWDDMEKDRAGVADALDEDSGWGSLDAASSSKKVDSPEDDFFNSLMSELSDNLDSPKQTTGTGNNGKDTQAVDDDADDFFSTLMSDLSESMDNNESTKPTQPKVPTQSTTIPTASSSSNTVSSPTTPIDEDDFFANLESDLSDSLDNSAPSDDTSEQPSSQRQPQTDAESEDDFFASLVTDLNKSLDSDNDNDTNERSDDSRDYAPPPVTSASTTTQTEKELDDDFFASLEADLSQSLDDGTSTSSPAPRQSNKEEDTEDDFFASLETDLSRSLDNSMPTVSSNTDGGSSSSSPSSSASSRADEGAVIEEDFFASLETELGEMLSGTSSPSSYSSPPPTTPDNTDVNEDDFFTNLVSDLNESLDTTMDGQDDTASQPNGIESPLPPPAVTTSPKKDEEDDFFASLETELSDKILNTDDTTNASPPPSLEEDILLNNDVIEITTTSTIATSSPKTTAKASTGADNEAALNKMTVVALKQILRERGLKVSGKKSELIARIGEQ